MRAPAAILDTTGMWRIILALGLGILSGTGAASVGMPLPWMLGPMIGVTIAALMQVPLQAPEGIRPAVIPVIGVMLGSAITAEVFADPARWGVTFAVLVPFLIVTAAVAYALFRKIGRYDPVTAYYSAMPGGLNDMLILGAEAGGDERRIALAHATRILVVISAVVVFFGAVLGVRSGPGTAWVALGDISAMDWLILGACAVLGLPLGRVLRLPARQILGPMILSGVAHLSGIVTVPPPGLLVVIAQVVIGTVVGCRFIGSSFRAVGRDLALGTVSAVVMIAVAVAFAWPVAHATDLSLDQAFLAFSPGGLTEMGLLALAMGADVAYVTVTHLVRITLVIFAASPVFRLIRRNAR